MIANDTYGPVTREELAELRAQARVCISCGMLATVDPAFHQNRYAHAPRYRDGATVMVWQQRRMRFAAVTP